MAESARKTRGNRVRGIPVISAHKGLILQRKHGKTREEEGRRAGGEDGRIRGEGAGAWAWDRAMKMDGRRAGPEQRQIRSPTLI